MRKIIGTVILCLAILQLSSQNIDTKHIQLILEFDWVKKQAYGSVNITCSPLKETDTIILDAGELSIHNVLLNNYNLPFIYNPIENSKNLIIKLNRNYKPNEELKIKIDYNTNHENRSDPNAISGSFGKGLRFQQPTSTSPNKLRQIYSVGEPEGNKYWFPCNEDIADIHTTEIYATIEKPFMVISNGMLLNVKDHPNGKHTFHYQSNVAFPNYLVSIVIGEYSNYLQLNGSTQILNYGYPHEMEAVKATVELIPDMMKFLEAKTDYSFPYSTYTQVVVQDYPFPGLVGQNGVAILSDNYIDDFKVHKDFQYLWDGVAMQALSNQWFGNLLMPVKWNDVWLNNAFAQYFAGLYTEKCHGNAEYQLWYYPYEKWNVTSEWESGNKHPLVPETIQDLNKFTADGYSKYKGALVLHMLQNELGEEDWWNSIRSFIRLYAQKQISTEDFRKTIESISGKSYQWFFDQWIYKMGMPKFKVSKNYNATQKILSIVVEQNESKSGINQYQQVNYFEGKIYIEIDNQIETILLKPKKVNTYNFSLPNKPGFVNFNYKQTYLSETDFPKSTEEYLDQLLHSKDLLAKQDAANNLVAYTIDSTLPIALKKKIKNALIQEVQSNQYWRYRMFVLGALSQITPPPYDSAMITVLKSIIRNEKSWLKSTAISILGNSKDPKFEDIYINELRDESDRVINSAAISLGKTKNPKVFEILMNLENEKSWKNQNRISALNGLQHLNSPKALEYVLACIKDIQSPRWYLATPTWDYPFAAVNTLIALGKGDLGFPILFERFKKSLQDNDLNDIFQNVQLINLLKDERTKEMYILLKDKFKNDSFVLESINNYEFQYLESLKS